YRETSLSACVDTARKQRATLKDPINLGWIYYYEYKCLYELSRHREAFSLFLEATGPKRTMLVFSYNNGMWMHSVAMELAYHLRDRRSVVRIAKDALELAKDDPSWIETIKRNRKIILEKLGR